MARHQPSKQIQTGRNLPTKFSSYNPSRHATPPPLPPLNSNQLPQKVWPRIVKRLIISLLLLLIGFGLVIGIWDARNISAATQKMFGSGNLFSLINATSLKSDTNERVNVLIAGYSADDPGHAGATLTDSIMLLSMRPANHTGYMLSIPRDLYVAIPGFGHAKINEVYKDGRMDLLVQTVQNIFDTQIGYYALVNYTAVRSIVDAIGGIDVTIHSPDGRLYDPNIDYTTGGPLVDLSNGTHHLNGQQALNLTRARGDYLPNTPDTPIGFGQSDFQRTADQRLVFTAIKSKLNWKLILNPRKNGKILNAIASNVKTNLSIDEARPLFDLFNSIPNSKLQSLSLRDLNGHNYLASTNYAGSTLVPAAGLDDYSQINSALAKFNQ
jgi:LCP family protein required for cell wall assembly